MKKIAMALASCLVGLLAAGCAATKNASQAVPLATKTEGSMTAVLTNDLSSPDCTRAGSLRARLLQEGRVVGEGCWKYMRNTQQFELSFSGVTYIVAGSEMEVRDLRAVRRAQIEAENEAQNLAGKGWHEAAKSVGAGFQAYADSQREKSRIYQQQLQRPWNQQFCSAVTHNCATEVRVVP